MAKVKGPLMSLDARGQVGKAIVFMGWKGLKTLRAHVVPANPKTTAQVTQRTKLTKMVDFWQNLLAPDKGGWDKQAPIEPKVMSGFNSATKHGIASQNAFTPGTAGKNYTSTPGVGDLTISVDILSIDDLSIVDSLTDIKVQHGTEIRNLATEVALVQAGVGDPYTVVITGLTAGIPVFTRIVRGATSLLQSGINVDTPT